MSKPLQFGSTYLCEAAFSALLAMKTKCRNTLNVENDLICLLSCIEPQISISTCKEQIISSFALTVALCVDYY